MRPTPVRSAIVTRLTPEGATLARAGGAAVLPGATVTDGEALTLATPTGDGGGVTLDRRGVALRLTAVRLPVAAPPVEEVATVAAPTPVDGPRANRRALPIVSEEPGK